MIVPALILAVALGVPSAAKKTATVVLVKTSGVPAAWRPELRRAAEGADVRALSWLEPPALSLEDAATALGCASWNDACAGQIAGMTGAAQALVLDVTGSATRTDIALRFVGEDGRARGAVRGLSVGGTSSSDLEDARNLVRAAVADRPITLVLIETDTPGVSVRIDDVEVGTTPLPAPLQVEPGAHRLLLSKEGRAPLSATLDLAPWQLFRESYVLGAMRPDPALKPTLGEQRPAAPASGAPAAQPASASAPVVGYVAAGIGGVIAIVGLGLTTTWVSGYVEAASDVENNNGELSRCLGLCDDKTGIGLGVSGPARDAYLSGAYSAWIGASVATVGVGVLLGATGLWLALSGDEPAEDAAAPAP